MRRPFEWLSPRCLSQLLAISILTCCLISQHQAQFIAHINSNAFRGNVSFDVREEANESQLVVESIIEAKQELKFSKDEKASFEKDHPILLDWTLHTNTLSPPKLAACSSDDLGPPVPDALKQSLTSGRALVLGQLSQWIYPLKDVLQSTGASSLGELIWEKSLRVKLSQVYFPPEPPAPPPSQAGPEGPPKQPARPKATPLAFSPAPINKLPILGGSRSPRPGGLSKPTLPGPIRHPTTRAPVKASFGPRLKPNISARVSSSSVTLAPPPLSKAQALVLDASPQLQSSPTTTSSTTTTTSTSTTTAKPRTTPPKDQPSTNRVLLKNYGRVAVCANIVDTRNVKSAEAVFESQISGRISLRGNEDGVTRIVASLYHIKSKVNTGFEWRILSSDVLDNRRHEDECKYLQLLFDPDNADDAQCTKGQTKNCKMGDLTRKHGQIQVAGLGKGLRQQTLIDLNLPISSLEGGSRSLFIAIYENSQSSRHSILSCAKIFMMKERRLEASFNMDGVRGSVKFYQRYPTEPTSVSYDLFGLEGNVRHMTIRDLPVPTRTSSLNTKLCNALGDIYDPTGSILGNLTGRHGALSVMDSEYEDHYSDEFIDLSIQLFGPETIVGRSIAIHKNNGDLWVCATIEYIDEPVVLALARFYYPVVGQISFRQLRDEAHSETRVLVELYNPNGDKSSLDHNWLIHTRPAMADFYNWSQRCESAGEVFDPIQVLSGLSGDQYGKLCNKAALYEEPLRCRSGDLSLKSNFKLSLAQSNLNKTRLFYTDPFLPLSKQNSIVARSVVIYDESAPLQRGNRLSCSTIKLVHPIKASVRSWNSGPSIPSAISGQIEFDQESATSPTKIKIDLSGFGGNVENYAIHNVWTQEDKEFPCSNDSLYDIYDPYDTDNSLRLPTSALYGSSATVDRVKVGDISRKHGTFEGLESAQRSHSDASASLFAPNSIVGRSIVLRAAVNDFRWVCGNIELDYDRSSAREIIGMASFDDPRSKVAGFVRFFQLEHKDGSLSDTYMHVDLRFQSDGIHELQTSEAHNWVIFVNQVGEDAYISADDVRCIAAGFKWNPYLAQDSLEAYQNLCNPQEQQACAMGDLGMKHGLLTLGPNNRRSFSDMNLPLTGNYSVMGRSLIIFDSKRPTVKLACANIFPDIHLKSNVVIKRMPSFTVARFVEQMRELLGAAEWLMVPELMATKPVANGECVQMTIHFYGQKAHQLQIELNNLITLGTVRKSTRIGVDKISTHYKLCRTGQMELPTSVRISAASSIHQVNHFLDKGKIILFQLSLWLFISRCTKFFHTYTLTCTQ